ncbi:hypothetical protein M2322_004125 [Rhodoblastus acidophilus]|nr:hypothetical protein [Rhodoblastus acidophilus]
MAISKTVVAERLIMLKPGEITSPIRCIAPS